MVLLKFEDKIKDLEQDKCYEEVVAYLYNLWQADKNVNNLLCLTTQIWLILVFWHEFEEYNFTREELSDLYTELINYGFENYDSDVRFLLVVGYVFNVIPYWYNDMHGDLEGWQKKGYQMIVKASVLDESNLIVKLFMCKKFRKRKKLVKKIIPIFNQYFLGENEVINYFKSICCN